MRDAGRLGRGRRCPRRATRPAGVRDRARDPAGLAQAVQGALAAGRDSHLRAAMQAYGREPIAERVLAVYRRTLARGAA